MRLTKGSFYHHFRDIDAYDERLFAFWEAQHTAGPIATADAGETGGSHRRRRLHDAVARLDLRVERAMQAWALRDLRAKQARARVDALRVAYLARLWQEEGATAAMAQRFARIEYTSFLGSMQLCDPETEAGARAARALAKELASALRATLKRSDRSDPDRR